LLLTDCYLQASNAPQTQGLRMPARLRRLEAATLNALTSVVFSGPFSSYSGKYFVLRVLLGASKTSIFGCRLNTVNNVHCSASFLFLLIRIFQQFKSRNLKVECNISTEFFLAASNWNFYSEVDSII